MTVTLRIAPEHEAAFTEFYHHRYIPALLSNVPEIKSVWRYEEFGVTGSLRWFNKQFITHYQLADGVSSGAIESALKRPGREELTAEWDRWKSSHLRDVERNCQRLIYRHSREPLDGPFGSRPFFRVSVETDPLSADDFNQWYHESYLPKIMADVPAWAACRRYQTVGRVPSRVHTIYEVENSFSFDEAFAAMRAPHRYSSNAEWDQWVGKAITWQDATSFRPIFRC